MITEILEHHILDHALGFKLFGFIPVTFHMLIMIIVSALLCVALPVIIKTGKPRFLFNGVRGLVFFVRDSIVLPSIGEEGRPLLPYFYTLFFAILFFNLAGMVPGGGTPTGNISVTAGLAITTFLLINIVGVWKQGGMGYLKTFIPEGTPVWLTPLVFPLEVLGLFTKTFALCIRLFANMIAGHMAVLCFIGLIFLLGAISKIAGVVAIAPVLGFSLFLNILELLVIVLQAYVFTLLTAIFTGAVVHPH